MSSILAKLKDKRAISAHKPSPRPSAAVSKLQQKVDFAKSEEGQKVNHSEITRIVNLPVELPMDISESEQFNRMALQATAYSSGFRLFDTQANSAMQFLMNRGLFGPIAVGWGKTLITLMCCNIGYVEFGIKKIVLMAPPSLMSQLLTRDLQWARTKIPINFPIHVLHDRKPAHRRSLSHSGQPGVYIMPYSLLSTKDSSDNLEAIEPGLIVCDEVQYLKDRRAARTRRVMEYIEKHRPLGAALSGTITRKSIVDYHHIIRWCLDTNCPLPRSVSMAMDWANVLDADADPGVDTSGAGPLKPLTDWAKRLDTSTTFTDDRSGFRRAYKLRMSTCPGVVVSGEADIGVSLIIENQPVKNYESHPNWEQLQIHMGRIEEEWVAPNGDEIEYAIHKHKWMYELSSGFYNDLYWPTAEEFAGKTGKSIAESEDILDRSKEHHALHQEYAKELRSFLMYEASKNLDTPMLVGANMTNHKDRDVPSTLYLKWKNMKDADFEERPDRFSRAIRVCPFKIDAATRWAKGLPAGKGGIIWVYHQEIGRWMVEELRKAGVKSIHCPAGNQANEQICDVKNVDKVMVASIKAHGTGKNLQHFQHQYVLQWPRPAQDAEQFLGRCHRNGQTADELTVVTNNTTDFDMMNFAACINDSLYIHQTTGTRQKMVLATYNPLPKMYPPELLIERGLKAIKLTREQVNLMQEKFGDFK